jgi:oxygen-independent coproporphyrinogen-3 oxidase
VHVPFCVKRCWYCDFNAYSDLDDIAPAYMAALARDAELGLSAPVDLGDRPIVTSIFIGGGTPSHVAASSLVAVIDAIRAAWPVADDVEITIECNPESAEPSKVAAYRAAGATRLSFGVQSLREPLLQTLGRAHDGATALRAIRGARRAGFDELNADLIFGVPGESDDDWRASLEGILELDTGHVSCYGLTYEEGTPLHAWRRLGRVTPVPDDDAARRWEMADEMLAGAGYARYEISNWARPGRECRHNLLYWSGGEYLGIGAGAHSHVADRRGSVRSWTLKPPGGYVRSVQSLRSTVAGSETIGLTQRASELMFLGLRREAGVADEDFAALTNLDLRQTFGSQIGRGVARGLLETTPGRVKLTHTGTLLANEALMDFLADD